jgi:hypothetical protein
MRSRLSPVLVGITLVYIGLVLFLLCVIGVFGLPHVLKDLNTLFEILNILGHTAMAACLLSLLGKLLCLAAPSEMRGKWAIFLAVPFLLFAAAVTAALTYRIDVLLELLPQTPRLNEYSHVAFFVGLAFFLIFLKNLAAYLDSDPNVRMAVVTMVVGVLVLLVYLFGRFLLFDVMLKNPQQSWDIFRAFVIVVLLSLGGFVICYGRLLANLRGEIKDVIRFQDEER